MAAIKHLSPSKIEALKCPESFRLRYIEKVPEASVGVMLAGRVVHKLNEIALIEVKDGKPLPSAKDLDDLFLPTWESQVKEEEAKESFIGWTWNEDDPEPKAKAESRALVRYVRESVLPGIRPHLIEHTTKDEYESEIGPFIVWCVLDLLEVGGMLTDWKTTVNKVSPFAAKSWFQMAAYSRFVSQVTGNDIVDARKIFLVRGKRPRHEIKTYKMGPSHREWFRQQAVAAWKLVAGGGYVANTGGWWCSAKFCSFHAMCQGELS